MHPVPLEIIISEMLKKKERQIDERPQLELPLPQPIDVEHERAASEPEDENRGVVIIDIFGDDSEDII